VLWWGSLRDWTDLEVLGVDGRIMLKWILNNFIEHQQMHQNDHFIVMLSQMLLHVSAHQRHRKEAHMILTSYLYVGVHYWKYNGIWSEVCWFSMKLYTKMLGPATRKDRK
jgi:hypothetical protein